MKLIKKFYHLHVIWQYQKVVFIILSLTKTLFFMQMIRGRLCDDTKPETFNQLWTVEEQVIAISTLCRFKLKS